MAIGRSKVVIVGIGSVGAAVAFNLVMGQICDDLVLIDLNEEKAWAEATDLQHSMGYSGSKMHVQAGTYAECRDADVVVIAAALPYIKGQTRLDMLGKAAGIMNGVIPAVMGSGFDGSIVVITNPVDVISWYVQKLSGLPESRVIGTGTALDSARLRYHLADVMHVDPQSVYALCMGEHGDSQMIPWSQVTVGGKKFLEILQDNRDRLKEFDIGKVKENTAQIAYRIVNAKGATTFGIASITVQIVNAILRDENKVIPVSAMLHGEYGENGIYAGVPAVINSQGVKELVEYHLTDSELEELARSFEVIKEAQASL
ncbi:L-lactate dehydrogenase [Clostridium sp. MCC353]|uniref:L-lactate dehydrogenase n=1 Tax=Clostridium sp. MCC353 TaxID=2592646 RepID=UPI001C027ECE|nr:L-lactate dehydrogenase [Clostridium sp. MCC353]MBT9775615.1 L-lactate dehydrogenase [Clostridium sp. MCC353]